MLFSCLVLIFCSPASWLNISKYRGVVRCAYDHWSSLPAFITVVCAPKLTLIFYNPTQEHIRVQRECFHCICFHVGYWARKSPPYKQIIDICCTKWTTKPSSRAGRERGTHWVGLCSASRAPNLHQGPPSFGCSQEQLGTLSHSPCHFLPPASALLLRSGNTVSCCWEIWPTLRDRNQMSIDVCPCVSLLSCQS